MMSMITDLKELANFSPLFEMYAECIAEKERIIFQRLAMLNIEYDIIRYQKARFKRLLCEICGNRERWWFDDGTDNGKHIVTFINSENNLNHIKYET